MSLQGILLIDGLGLALILLLVNLVRTKRLYVSYAIIWILAVVGLMVIVSVPSLLYVLPELVGAVYPASALSLLAFLFIFVVLIFMSVKFSTLSARQVQLIQQMALQAAEEDEGPTANQEEEGS